MIGDNRDLELSPEERTCLRGDAGPALQFAMQLVTRAAAIMGARRLIPTTFLHIDACHYYGRAHVDFARLMLEQGATFGIPAWTNTITLSLTRNDSRLGVDATATEEARELATLYTKMGARPVWTCAPYQLPGGPEFGDQITVGESNAVAYYNAVVGARTNKYGDFLDVACGLTGRVPEAGLHLDEARRARLLIQIEHLPEPLRHSEFFCQVLGHLTGRLAGSTVPVITGLPPDATTDGLKALASAAAASGGIEMFHATGVTPEAPDLATALQGRPPEAKHRITTEALIAARDSLSSARPGPLAMVALGTPHFSVGEFERFHGLLDGRRVHPDLVCYISTSRHVASIAAACGWIADLENAGVTILTDTCTYFGPAVHGARGRVMTHSAKWAYYAPGMLPVEVAFGSLEDCAESAVAGEVRRDPAVWSDHYWGAA